MIHIREIQINGTTLLGLESADHGLRAQNRSTQLASGKVVDGRVELDGELPEGASVTVITSEGNETFTADPATERMLLAAIAQCERGETISMEQLLSELRDRE